MKVLKMIKEDDKFDKRCARPAHCWEIKGAINKQRNILCSWIRRLSVVKMSILPKLINKFNTIFFVELEKLILKFTWKYKGHRTAKHFEKEFGESYTALL